MPTPKVTVKQKPGAKPWKPTEEDLEKIREWAGYGCTVETIAAGLDISVSTFYKGKRLIPQISQAYESGKEKAIIKVAGGLFTNATTPTEHSPGGHVGAQTIYLKAKAGWAEKNIIATEEDKPIEVKVDRTDEERRQILEGLVQIEVQKRIGKGDKPKA